jgi:WD40 repeat protein
MIPSRTPIALAALLTAAAALHTHTAAAQPDGKTPAKVEFKGWFSNPVFAADGKSLVYGQMAALPYGARTGPTQIIRLSSPAAKEMRRIEGPDDDSLVGPVAMSPDGKRMALGLWNTSVRLYDLDSGKPIGRVEGSRGAQNVCFAPDGSTVAWLQNGDVHLADPATAKELRAFAKDADGPTVALAFGARGLITAHAQSTDITGAGGGKNRTFKWDITYFARDATSGKKLFQVGDMMTETRKSLEGRPQFGLFPSADGKTVVLAGDRGMVQWCDATTGKKTREVPCPWKSAADDPVRKVAVSANGQVAAVATGRGVVSVWDLAAGKELGRLDTAHSIDHLTLPPDGRTVAITYQIGGQVGAVLLVYEVGAAK